MMILKFSRSDVMSLDLTIKKLVSLKLLIKMSISFSVISFGGSAAIISVYRQIVRKEMNVSAGRETASW